jgi:hypothetical protein
VIARAWLSFLRLRSHAESRNDDRDDRGSTAFPIAAPAEAAGPISARSVDGRSNILFITTRRLTRIGLQNLDGPEKRL